VPGEVVQSGRSREHLIRNAVDLYEPVEPVGELLPQQVGERFGHGCAGCPKAMLTWRWWSVVMSAAVSWRLRFSGWA